MKAQALRAYLMSVLGQDFVSDPDRLDVCIPEGTAQSSLTSVIAYSWSYTCEVTLIDFTGHPDEVMSALIIWARRWEPELFKPGAAGISFDADILSADKVDMRVRLKLTEGVNVEAVAEPAPGRPPFQPVPVPSLPAPFVDRAEWEDAVAGDPPEPAPLHEVTAGGVLVAHCTAHPDA